MKIFVVLMALLIPVSTYAAPFLVATKGVGGGDPVSYEFAGLPLTPTVVAPQADGNFKIDLVNLPAGTYTVTVRASNLWGVSAYSSPFTFTRPVAVAVPTALGLSAQ